MTTIEKIVDLLKSRKITQKTLANDIGVTESTLSEWKSGRLKLSIEDVVVISKYFDVSTDYLLGSEYANTITNSHNNNIVQGNRARTITVTNGEKSERVLSVEATELLRIYEALDLKGRISLLTTALELEGSKIEQ